MADPEYACQRRCPSCRHLGNEADNLCRWFGEELCAVKVALRCPECKLWYMFKQQMTGLMTCPDALLEILLKQRREHLLLLLEAWWKTSLVDQAFRFDEHIRTAEVVAHRLTGAQEPKTFVWLTTLTMDSMPEESEDMGAMMDSEEPNAQDVLAANFLADKLEGDIEPYHDGTRVQPTQRPDDELIRSLIVEPTTQDLDSEPDITIVGDAKDVGGDVELVIEWTAPVRFIMFQ
jgi:hypothetical protein